MTNIRTDPLDALRAATSRRVSYVAGTIAELQHGLWCEEAALVKNAVETRRRQFEAGRSAAREALASFGVRAQPILRGAVGEPLWPDGFVGSITHTRSVAAAAVASRDDFQGIGIDIDSTDALPPGLLGTIATREEIDRFLDHPAHVRPLLGKVVFCAKEAVYKAVWPTGRELIDFHDVEVVLHVGLTRFTALPRKNFSGADCLCRASGWLSLLEQQIAAVLLLPAS